MQVNYIPYKTILTTYLNLSYLNYLPICLLNLSFCINVFFLPTQLTNPISWWYVLCFNRKWEHSFSALWHISYLNPSCHSPNSTSTLVGSDKVISLTICCSWTRIAFHPPSKTFTELQGRLEIWFSVCNLILT